MAGDACDPQRAVSMNLRRVVPLTMSYVDSALLNLTEWLCRRFQGPDRQDERLGCRPAHEFEHCRLLRVGCGLLLEHRSGLADRSGPVLWRAVVTLSQTLLKVPISVREQRVSPRRERAEESATGPRRAPAHIVSDAVDRAALPGRARLHPCPRADRPPGHSLIVLMTIVLYVLACDPLPPGGGRVWVWLRG